MLGAPGFWLDVAKAFFCRRRRRAPGAFEGAAALTSVFDSHHARSHAGADTASRHTPAGGLNTPALDRLCLVVVVVPSRRPLIITRYRQEFATSESGLRTLDIRAGKGSPPGDGDVCVVAWTGYTAGYQGKRIESTQDYDEPFSFRLGAGEAIPAFEEAVRGMTVGGLRRVEVPGELVERLAYPIEPKAMRYAAGPRPKTFAGQRALDFVLDNQTLKPFNRTLLFDIRLDAVR